MTTEQKSEETDKRSNEAKVDQSLAPSITTEGPPQSGTVRTRQAEQSGDLADQIKHTDRIIARSSIATAFLTFILAFLAGLQACSFIESERAFVILGSIYFGDDFSNASITLRNIGKHVAVIKSIDAELQFGIKGKHLPQEPDYTRTVVVAPPGPIGPNSEDVITAIVDLNDPRRPIPLDQVIAGVKDGSIPLWIYGRIKYDIGYLWWRDGALGFCMKFIPEAQRVPHDKDHALRNCVEADYTYIN